MTDYKLIKQQMEALADDCTDYVPVMANTSALLFYSMGNINWAGFYLVKDDVLMLGPFQGKIACDSESRSEIVVPVHRGGEIFAVLDIDSTLPARFSSEDREGLVDLVTSLEKILEK